jgi:predicted N-acetyltransferase YhbS
MHIRTAAQKDIPLLEGIAREQGDRNEADYFAKSLAEQAAGNRVVFIAEQNGHAVGYVQLNWKPTYIPFRRLDIPEIQDLCVIPAARRQGIGVSLVEMCENLAREMGQDGYRHRCRSLSALWAQRSAFMCGADIFRMAPASPMTISRSRRATCARSMTC